MTRLRPIFLSVGALALVLSACASTQAWAAIVNGTEISRSEFTDQLDAIEGNDELAAFFSAATGVSVSGEGDSAGSEFAAVWLTQLIQSEILSQAAEESGVEVTDSIEAVGSELAPSQFLTPNQEEQLLAPEEQLEALATRFEELPAVFRDAAIAQLASLVAFAKPEEDVQIACGRHILVSTQPDPTTGQAPDSDAALAEAEALRARIAAGEDFAQVAATESDDPGSAQAGGDLGCLSPGQTVPEFDAVLFAQMPGELSEPVSTDFGFHIIEVTEQVSGPFEDLTLEQQVTAITAELQAVDPAELQTLIEDADVEVDASYGEWVVDAEGARVVAPESADVQEQPPEPPTDTGPADGQLPTETGPAETPNPTG